MKPFQIFIQVSSRSPRSSPHRLRSLLDWREQAVTNQVVDMGLLKETAEFARAILDVENIDVVCSTIIRSSRRPRIGVVADAKLRMGGHQPAVGISQRYSFCRLRSDSPASPRTGRFLAERSIFSARFFVRPPPPVPPSSISPSGSSLPDSTRNSARRRRYALNADVCAMPSGHRVRT